MPAWPHPVQEERKELLTGGEAGLRQRRAQLEGDAVAAAEEVTGGLRRTRQVRLRAGASLGFGCKHGQAEAADGIRAAAECSTHRAEQCVSAPAAR